MANFEYLPNKNAFHYLQQLLLVIIQGI